MLAAEVVTADGQVLQVDAQTHPDLFWALRGGGGNFGVVTRFTFRVHPLGMVVGGILLLPATPEVVAGFMAEAETAPEELSAIANVMPIPPMPFVPAEQHGKLGVMALMLWSGDQESGTRIIDRFRALATPIADLVKPMPYPQMYPPEEEDYRPTAEAKTMFMDRVDVPMARTIVGWLEDSDAAMRVAQLRVLGGAMARVPADATAFAHRASKIMVNVAAFYDGPEDRPVRAAWVADFAAALQQEDRGSYVNFISDHGEDWMQRPTLGRPGTGCGRSSAATTRPTCSTATTTSRPPRTDPGVQGGASHGAVPNAAAAPMAQISSSCHLKAHHRCVVLGPDRTRAVSDGDADQSVLRTASNATRQTWRQRRNLTGGFHERSD